MQRGQGLAGNCLSLPGGGAAHNACAVADALGMPSCRVRPFPSCPSSDTLGLAGIRATRSQAMEAVLDDRTRLDAAARLDALGVEALTEMEAQGVRERDVALVHVLHLRARGTKTTLPVPFDDLTRLRAAFAEAHRDSFGVEHGDTPLVIVSVQCEAIGKPAHLSDLAALPTARRAIGVDFTAPVFIEGAWTEARFVRREALGPDNALTGPAVLVGLRSVILIEPGWLARAAPDQVELRRIEPHPPNGGRGHQSRPDRGERPARSRP